MSWVEPVTLAGTQVRLEPAGEEHLADLVAAGADPVVWAHMPWPQPRDRAAMRALLETERRVALPFAQIEVATGRAIGITTYRDIDERNRTLEIGGTWLGRPWWRTAINTEAKLLFLGHAFDDLRANRVAIKTDIRNERSQAAIARLGAKREGVLRHQMIRPDGSLRDTVMFSVIPEEWPGVREHLRARLATHTVTSATTRS
jgi:RimJ/RimL family protein N-acetyltransferase